MDRVINPAAFAAPAPYRFGTSAPYIQDLRKFFGEDVSVLKNTKVNERFSTELTGHFINLFNSHRFTEVDTNFSNATFGRTKSASFPRFIQLGLRLRFGNMAADKCCAQSNPFKISASEITGNQCGSSELLRSVASVAPDQ